MYATGPTFAPSLLYALWFGSRESTALAHGIETIQYEHVFGPILVRLPD